MENERIILFDGVCNLCNSTVEFVINRDEGKKFRFAPLQSDKGEELTEEYGVEEDTLVLLKDGKCYTKSSAYIRILEDIGGSWKAISVILRLVPKPVRDFLYDTVSRYRYRVFGKRDTCMTPDEDWRDRFISEKS